MLHIIYDLACEMSLAAVLSAGAGRVQLHHAWCNIPRSWHLAGPASAHHRQARGRWLGCQTSSCRMGWAGPLRSRRTRSGGGKRSLSGGSRPSAAPGAGSASCWRPCWTARQSSGAQLSASAAAWCAVSIKPVCISAYNAAGLSTSARVRPRAGLHRRTRPGRAHATQQLEAHARSRGRLRGALCMCPPTRFARCHACTSAVAEPPAAQVGLGMGMASGWAASSRGRGWHQRAEASSTGIEPAAGRCITRQFYSAALGTT